MDTATFLNGVVWLIGVVLHAALPTLDLLIPPFIAYLVHRYVKNKNVSDVLTDMAGIAYSHMSTQFAMGSANFGTVRNAAVLAVTTGMTDAAKLALAKMSQQEIATGVNAKLGQLLADDPNFAVTDPLGKAAAKSALAAATAAAGVAAALSLPATPEVGATPEAGSVSVPTATPVNFDMASLAPFIQDAVRQGIEVAVHNGSVR